MTHAHHGKGKKKARNKLKKESFIRRFGMTMKEWANQKREWRRKNEGWRIQEKYEKAKKALML